MDDITKWVVPTIVGAVIAIATMMVNWRLQRGARLHEKKFEAISQLYPKLLTAHYCLQRAASSVRFEGEDTSSLRQEAAKLLSNAAQIYCTNALLLPEDICVKIDKLFRDFQEAQLDLAFAMDMPVKNGYERKARWDQVQKLVFTDLPPILDDLKAHSRKLLRT